ncbi:MAG: hypothetical protein EXQ94_08635 [Alphaproteobacteria bacterium]|nr:hypothetical protein [Alphaproteobacteria bacterium]
MSHTTVDHHSALIYTMVLISASDREMRDAELRRIGDIVRRLPVFNDFDENDLPDVARQCAAMLSGKDGLAMVLTVIEQALPKSLRETAYALAWEIAIVDTPVGREEKRLIDLIGEKLGLSHLVTAAIGHACRARHKSA